MATPNLAKNTVFITGALMFQKALSFVYFWYISNNLFAEQLGQYVFALSFAAIFSILIDIGLSPVLTREAAKNTTSGNQLLRNVLGIKLPLSAIALAAILILINLTGKPVEIKLLVYLSSFIMILDSFTLSFWVTFRSHQRVGYESIATVLVQIIIFSLGIYALETTGQVRHLIMALMVASLFNFLFSAILLKIKLHYSLKPAFDKHIVRSLIRMVPAFFLAGIFLKVFNSIDSVLLSFLINDQAVGYYAIAAKVVTSLQQVIPGAFAAVIFPAFSLYAATPEKLTKTFTTASAYLLIISIPLTVGIVALTPQIITMIWPAYEIVIPNFRVMTLALPFIFLAFPTGYLLNATNHQMKNTRNRGIITLLFIILNVVLIPTYSFLGAGIAFLVAHSILLLLDLHSTNKVITINFKRLGMIALKSTTASIAMLILIEFMLRYSYSILLIIPIAIFVYFGSLHALKTYNLNDIRKLRAQVRG